MEQKQDSTQDDFVNYLPGMPKLSDEPGTVERFLKTVFRRRGGLKVIVHRDNSPK